LARVIVVTGSASGIGAATRAYLEHQGCVVIGVDLQDADIDADLASTEGRQRMVAEVAAHSPPGIDGIVANAGLHRSDSMSIRVNYFGAVATLEGLRPLLRPQEPRAVLVASRAVLLPVADDVLEACLGGDEELAVRLADGRAAHDRGLLYPTSKRAAARWLRRAAPSADWAGSGIPLNAVAPGSVRTAMTAHRSAEEQGRLLQERPMPLGGQARPEEVAPVIGWFLHPENTKVSGQVLFVDGAGEALMRVEDIWAGSLASPHRQSPTAVAPARKPEQRASESAQPAAG
jgi:NAD(P)-dependent dehydrogenase (short-subunit alcohol dehydrogenase family)